jgi:hypothetical protein
MILMPEPPIKKLGRPVGTPTLQTAAIYGLFGLVEQACNPSETDRGWMLARRELPGALDAASMNAVEVNLKARRNARYRTVRIGRFSKATGTSILLELATSLVGFTKFLHGVSVQEGWRGNVKRECAEWHALNRDARNSIDLSLLRAELEKDFRIAGANKYKSKRKRFD